MESVSASKYRRYVHWFTYLLSGAIYAILVVVFSANFLFFTLRLAFRNLLLTLYLCNIIIGILPGLSSNRKQLFEFLILAFTGSLICSIIGLVIIDWQASWFGVSFSILFVFLASLEFSIVAVLTHFVRMKLKKKK